MADRKTLVVYYSRQGHTKDVAWEIARRIGAQIEVIDAGNFAHGFLWYLRAGWASLTGRDATIAKAEHDPRDFDLVVLATPVWVGRPAPPMRSYLREHGAALPAVACALTHGGGDASMALDKLEALAGKVPIARVMLSDIEKRSGAEPAKIVDFVAALAPHRQANAA